MGRVSDELRNAVLQKFAGVPAKTETQPVQERIIEESIEEKKQRLKAEVAHKKEVAKLEEELRKLKETGDQKQSNFSMAKPASKNLGENALVQVMNNREKQIRNSVPCEKRKKVTENVNTRLVKELLGKLMP